MEVSIFIVGLLVGQILPSYFKEKGKNLATKEDITQITEKIESVKHTYALLIEEYRKRERLRFAAFDRRLEVHQQAFALWWELVGSIHSDEVGQKVETCQNFWVENCLYLTAEASHAFRTSFHAASDHRVFKGDSEESRPNFERILEAGNIIRKAIELPPLKEEELPKGAIVKSGV